MRVPAGPESDPPRRPVLGDAPGVRVLVVSRFAVPEEGAAGFADRARVALETFAARPGFRRGRVGRAVDEPAEWVLTTEWDGVGAYRRALSAYEVKVDAAPLLAQARDEAGAFEVLLAVEGGGPAVATASDRAADAGTAAPGQRVGPDDPRRVEGR